MQIEFENSREKSENFNIRIFQGFFGALQLCLAENLVFSFFDIQRLNNFIQSLKYNYSLQYSFKSELLDKFNVTYEVIYKGKCIGFPSVKETLIEYKEIPLFYSIQKELVMHINDKLSFSFNNLQDYQDNFAFKIINAYEEYYNCNI